MLGRRTSLHSLPEHFEKDRFLRFPLSLSQLVTGLIQFSFRKLRGGEISPIEINPVHFSAPLSPYAASMVEGRPFPWGILRERMEKLTQNYQGPFLVEGAGGWRVPLDSSLGIREWAQELSLPVVVVARNSLGTLNHTLLTVDSIRQSNLTLLGIVLNDTTPKPDDSAITNPALLEQLTRLPVLSLPYQSTQLPSLPAWLTPL